MKITMKQARIGSRYSTQTAMAKVLGIRQERYSRMERNPEKVPHVIAEAFAEAAGVTTADIDWTKR